MSKNAKDRTASFNVSDFEKLHTELPTASVKTGIWYKPIFHVFLIIMVGFIAYSNTFLVPFVFDDNRNIIENPFIRNFESSPELSKAKELFIYILSNNRSISYLTFALDYRMHGLQVTGYHIVNLAVHVVNALLLYWLILLTFTSPFFKVHGSSLTVHKNTSSTMSYEPSPEIALLSALLFVSHPIQTQAVTYIVQRFTSLAALFCLLSLVLYIQFRLKNTEVSTETTEKQRTLFSLQSILWYPASVLSAVLAMKTKEITFTLPVMIALYEFLFFEGKLKRRVLSLIPFLLTMLIIPLTLLGTDKPLGELISDVSEATRIQTAMSRWDYLFTQFRVILTYIRLLFVPINQNLDYDYPVYHSFFDPPVFLSFLFLSLLFILAIYLLRLPYQSPTPSSSPSTTHHSPLTSRSLRLISFGILWFFITLSVESSVIPIADVIFEHRMYLPSVGIMMALSTALFYVASRVRVSRIFFGTVYLLISAIVLILSIGTYTRNMVWADKISLWTDVIKKSPSNPRAYHNLGLAYSEQNNLDKALDAYNRAITLNPNISLSYNNRGNIYTKAGQYWMALKDYSMAISIKPDLAEAYNNRGIIYFKFTQYDKAIEDYTKAVTLNPDSIDVYNNRGNAYDEKGMPDKAIADYNKAISMNPNYAAAYYNRGVTSARLGRTNDAGSDFQKACRLGSKLGCEALEREL